MLDLKTTTATQIRRQANKTAQETVTRAERQVHKLIPAVSETVFKFISSAAEAKHINALY